MSEMNNIIVVEQIYIVPERGVAQLCLDVCVCRAEKYTPQRSGLRERHRAESPTQREPSILEKWTPEEKLELWEIKLFAEK